MTASIDEREARMLLAEERTRLQQIRLSLTTDPLGTEEENAGELSLVDQHPADVATETFERERDMTILEHIEGQLSDLERAMERLERGTYGTCEACGRPIDADRLRARPAARLCVDDQARTERSRA